MSNFHIPPDIGELLIVVVLSTISGAVGIARRIINGHRFTIFAVITEFLTAIFCGYLMHAAYPSLAEHLPAFVNQTVAIAFAAHSGGRIMQAVEQLVVSYLTQWEKPKIFK